MKVCLLYPDHPIFWKCIVNTQWCTNCLSILSNVVRYMCLLYHFTNQCWSGKLAYCILTTQYWSVSIVSSPLNKYDSISICRIIIRIQYGFVNLHIAGIQAGLDILGYSGQCNGGALIVVTDGEENTDPRISDVEQEVRFLCSTFTCALRRYECH